MYCEFRETGGYYAAYEGRTCREAYDLENDFATRDQVEQLRVNKFDYQEQK